MMNIKITTIPFSGEVPSFEELVEIEALKESCNRPNSPLEFLGRPTCPLYSLENGTSDEFRSHRDKGEEQIGLKGTD